MYINVKYIPSIIIFLIDIIIYYFNINNLLGNVKIVVTYYLIPKQIRRNIKNG